MPREEQGGQRIWGSRGAAGNVTRHQHPASSAYAARSSSPPLSGSECTCRETGKWQWRGQGWGGCPAHTKWALLAETPCQGRGRGVSYVTGPSGAILSGSPAAEPCLFLLLITSLLWFLPGEELDGEKQRMLFKSVLLETRSKQEGFVWLPGQARADAEEGGPASTEQGAFSLLPTPSA